MKLIDLSQTISEDMPMFSPTAPRPIIEPWLSHGDAKQSGNYIDCSCEINYVEFITSAGTYMDAPFHFDPKGKTIDQLNLDQLVLDGVRIDCLHMTANEPITPNVLNGVDIEGKAVLFWTGWSRYWGEAQYYEFPYISEETALALKDGGAKLAGVDFLVIDNPKDKRRPAHVNLLQNNILIVENLTRLDQLPENNFVFHAAPVKIAGAAAFPVRAYAVVNA